VKDTEEAALALLEATPAILRPLLAGLPATIVEAKLDRDWSPKDVLAHFVDVEQDAFGTRLRRMIDEDRPAIASIDPLARLGDPKWTARTVDSLLDELARERATTVAWLRTLNDEQLQRAADHDAVGEITVANLLHYWPTHDMAHIRQIQRMLSAVLRHEMGAAENFDV
jgi:hypothetical protein